LCCSLFLFVPQLRDPMTSSPLQVCSGKPWSVLVQTCMDTVAIGSYKLDLRSLYPLGILVFAVLLFFPGLGARDLWAPVEPRYAEIARVMFSKGEWIVPTINGELYTDKPILFFWIVLGAANILGAVDEWTVRLPAALGGVGFILASYFFARDFFNARVGAIAAIVLATSFRVIWESRWAHIDMLFGFFFLLSIYFGARAFLRRGGPNEILLAYVFMALATLAKGLIGVVLPALLFAALMLARRDWSMMAAAKLPLGIPLFALVAAPWFYLVNRATAGKWVNDFIYIHHIRRYTAGVGHRQPFYYYFTTLPVDFLPWTTFAIPAVIAFRDYRRYLTEPQIQFCLAWFLTVFGFFTISDTKRDLYLLPLLPPLAFLVGNYLDGLENGVIAPSATFKWLTTIFFSAVAATGLLLPIAAWIGRPEAFWPLLPSGLVLAAGGIIAAALIARRRPLTAIVCVSVMMMLMTAATSLWVFPYLEQFKSHRQFSLRIKQIVSPRASLYVFSDSMNDFNFYTGREKIPVLTATTQVDALRLDAEKSYLLVKERDLRKLPNFPAGSIIASTSIGSTTWRLVDLKTQAPN
jgi:4-amino-4-deoxy-L-arabinose transferase-like glycosyltransferase